MNVVGARFADLRAAMAARDAILGAVPMPPADIAVRPLGTTQYDDPIEAFLLAGRFDGAAVPLVTRVVHDHGGTVIWSRTEWKSRSRPTPEAGVRRAPARRPATTPRKRLRRPVARSRVRAARAARFTA